MIGLNTFSIPGLFWIKLRCDYPLPLNDDNLLFILQTRVFEYFNFILSSLALILSLKSSFSRLIACLYFS